METLCKYGVDSLIEKKGGSRKKHVQKLIESRHTPMGRLHERKGGGRYTIMIRKMWWEGGHTKSVSEI